VAALQLKSSAAKLAAKEKKRKDQATKAKAETARADCAEAELKARADADAAAEFEAAVGGYHGGDVDVRDARTYGRMGEGWGAALDRQLEAEELQYKKKGRNAAGTVVAQSQREWVDAQRANPACDLLHGEEAEQMQEQYFQEMLDAAISALEKVGKDGITGASRPDCTTAWQKEALALVARNTMRSESLLGVMKKVTSEKLTMSDARKKAICMYRLNDPLKTLGRMSAEAEAAVMEVSSSLVVELDASDAAIDKKHDAEALERKMRGMKKVARDAALQYANARLLHGLDRAQSRADLERVIAKCTWNYEKIENLQEEIDIVVIGGGYDGTDPDHPLRRDMKMKKSGTGHCAGCGFRLHKAPTRPQQVEHMMCHAAACIVAVEEGGWPEVPPDPRVAIKKVPPVLMEDQSQNPVYTWMRKVTDAAMLAVKEGRISATIERAEDAEPPAIDDSLKGKRVEYVFDISEVSTPDLVAYTGEVMEWDNDGQSTQSGPKGRKAKAVKVPRLYLKWFSEGKGLDPDAPSWVNLKLELYGKGKQDGWLLLSEEAEVTEEEQGHDFLKQLTAKREEADWFCPPEEV
jgi:hypothetical protein